MTDTAFDAAIERDAKSGVLGRAIIRDMIKPLDAMEQQAILAIVDDMIEEIRLLRERAEA